MRTAASTGTSGSPGISRCDPVASPPTAAPRGLPERASDGAACHSGFTDRRSGFVQHGSLRKSAALSVVMSSNSGRKTYWESASQMAPSWTVYKGSFQCVVFFFLCELSNLFPAFPSLAGRHLLQRPEGGLRPAALSVSLGAHPLRQEQRELAR